MEDQRGQALVAPTHHRRQNRVVEPAQGRIGLHAAHVYIHAVLAHQRRRPTRRALLVIAAIGHTSRDREAVRHWLQRQLGGGEHIPYHVGPAKVGIHPVAAVVRQLQLLAGKCPRLLGVLQARAQLR
ncbi:hypothetical protein D3C72_567520 [compost metagenome]